MGIIKVSIEELCEGDVIFEDLFADQMNISLIMKGTIVNERVRNKLKGTDIGKILIDRVGVEDEEIKDAKENMFKDDSEKAHYIKKVKFKEGYVTKVSDIKSIFKSILDDEEIDLEKVEAISEDIFKSVDDIYVAIESLSELKDFDEYTYIHSINVALYSILLAKWLKIEKSDIRDLVKAAVLHDIGKSKVYHGIINKPGELTDKEFIEMRNHPKYGYDICENMDGISDRIKEAILSHHEKIDGSGYPNGLKKNEISLFSKIIAVCDVYDAITSKRAYKDKITPFETFEEMIEHGYGKLDTEIMLTFLQNIGNLYVGLKVKLNTGEIGEIVFIPLDKLSHPLIKVGEKFIDFSEDNGYKIEKIV